MNDVVTVLLIVGALAACVFIMGRIGRHRVRAARGDSGTGFGIAGSSADCSPGSFGGHCGNGGGDCGDGGGGA
jgi:hypothetical protein